MACKLALFLLCLSPADALNLARSKKWVPLHGIRDHDRYALGRMDLETWATIGSQDLQYVKQNMTNSTPVLTRMTEACGFAGDVDDSMWNCDWQEIDTMLCEELLQAGRQNLLGDLDTFKKAMLAAPMNPEFAELVAPEWRGEYRLRESPNNEFDKMMLGVKEDSSFLDVAVDQICSTSKVPTDLCSKNAKQHLLCQKVEEAAVGLMGWAKIVPMIAHQMSANGDVDEILRHSADTLRQRPLELFTAASKLTQEAWVENGPQRMKDLKNMFVALPVVHEKVSLMCSNTTGGLVEIQYERMFRHPGDTTDDGVTDYHMVATPAEVPDCHWKYTDSLFCDVLEQTEMSIPTIDGLDPMDVLKTSILSNIRSDGTDGFDGVDWSFRSALIARWWVSMGPSHTSAPMSLLKAQVQESEDFKALLHPMCWDVSPHRPGCFDAARQGLWCQALAQGVLHLPGNTVDSVMEAMASRLSCYGRGLPDGHGAAYMDHWIRADKSECDGIEDSFQADMAVPHPDE